MNDEINVIPAFIRVATEFEAALGSEQYPESLLSNAMALHADEEERFSEDLMPSLHALGLSARYVPKALGGQLNRFDEFFAIGRALSRRDLSAVVSYSTLIWAVLIWMRGTPEQQRTTAQQLLEMKFPCLAYSEAEHGADLLHNQTVLMPNPLEQNQWHLTGVKWPINRACSCTLVFVLAKHYDLTGWRANSLVLLDRRQAPVQSIVSQERERTHGLRACDIGGIRFIDTPVCMSDMVGEPGEGLEWSLKGLQVTRTSCAPLALGAMDSMLRLTAEFLLHRNLYGGVIIDHPVVSTHLVRCWAALIVSEVVAMVASRALHIFPAQFSSWSLVVKTYLASNLDECAATLKRLLGARFYMRTGHVAAVFQKMLRDSEVIALFDGSSSVCLDGLAAQLPLIFRVSGSEGRYRPSEDELRQLFSFELDLPDMPWSEFDLNGHGKDAVLAAWPLLKARFRQAVQTQPVEFDGNALLATLDNQLVALESDVTKSTQARLDANLSKRRNLDEIKLTQKFCELHACIASIGLWLFNRDHLSGMFSNGLWLKLLLESRACFETHAFYPSAKDSQYAMECLKMQLEQRRMFSLFRWDLPNGYGLSDCRLTK